MGHKETHLALPAISPIIVQARLGNAERAFVRTGRNTPTPPMAMGHAAHRQRLRVVLRLARPHATAATHRQTARMGNHPRQHLRRTSTPNTLTDFGGACGTQKAGPQHLDRLMRLSLQR